MFITYASDVLITPTEPPVEVNTAVLDSNVFIGKLSPAVPPSLTLTNKSLLALKITVNPSDAAAASLSIYVMYTPTAAVALSLSSTPLNAYGEVNETLIQEVKKTDLPQDMEPKVGMGLVSKSPDGQEINLMVVEVKEETIVIDGNHPLAGRDLIFDLEVVEIIASEVKA